MSVHAPTSHLHLSPSALQSHLNTLPQKTPLETLPHEILHNLRHQHNWTNLSILKPPNPSPETIPSLTLTSNPRSHPRPTTTSNPTLLTGHPPSPLYTHPITQSHLLLHPLLNPPPPQLEYILPLTLGQSFTLRLLQSAFDAIPPREPITGENGFKHQDAKRILLAMRGRQGFGGDGTVNYYIVQEGEVKPRQN